MSFVGEPDPILWSSPRTSVAEDNDNNKTVDPSQKRLVRTREHGDVAKSHEVSDSLMLAGVCPVMDFYAAASGGDLNPSMCGPIAHSSDLQSDAHGLTCDDPPPDRGARGAVPALTYGARRRPGPVGGSANAGTAEGPAAPLRQTSVLKAGAVNFRKEIASIAVIGSGPGVEE